MQSSHILGGNEEVSYKDMIYRQEVTQEVLSAKSNASILDGEVCLLEKKRKLRLIEKRKGFKKIQKTAELAKSLQVKYVWVDTCAIDKDSSAELTESINSMFKWYSRAVICFAYLEDVSCSSALEDASRQSVSHLTSTRKRKWSTETFVTSRWFTRGWTLLELLAPTALEFRSAEWKFLGTKADLCKQNQEETYIPDHVISRPSGNLIMSETSVAQRMSWASGRETTRPEDMAYCLMGLFGIQMPLVYGEGAKGAFIRLQKEIIKVCDDQTIFVWQMEGSTSGTWRGPLAITPKEFGRIVRGNRRHHTPFQTTNVGLQVSLPLQELERADDIRPWSLTKGHVIGWLECYKHSSTWGAQLGIFLLRVAESQYVRVQPDKVIIEDKIPDVRISNLIFRKPTAGRSLIRDPLRVWGEDSDLNGPFLFNEAYMLSGTAQEVNCYLVRDIPCHWIHSPEYSHIRPFSIEKPDFTIRHHPNSERHVEISPLEFYDSEGIKCGIKAESLFKFVESKAFLVLRMNQILSAPAILHRTLESPAKPFI